MPSSERTACMEAIHLYKTIIGQLNIFQWQTSVV